MFQVCAAAILLMLSTGIGAAQQLPQFDIEATCRAAHPLGPEDRDPYQGCMKDEGIARSEVQRQWTRFEAGNRDTCVEETGIGGYPSYVEVLTCLQMFGGTPTTTLKLRRRGDQDWPATSQVEEPRPAFDCALTSLGHPSREEVAEWLSGADFTLFFAGSTYAVVKTSVVESWPRVTSKRISSDVRAVTQGTFDFAKLEPLLAAPHQDEGDDEA